jgi:hypothetical protein
MSRDRAGHASPNLGLLCPSLYFLLDFLFLPMHDLACSAVSARAVCLERLAAYRQSVHYL